MQGAGELIEELIAPLARRVRCELQRVARDRQYAVRLIAHANGRQRPPTEYEMREVEPGGRCQPLAVPFSKSGDSICWP